MSTHVAMIDAYLAGPQALRSQVSDLTREQLLARPVPGKWSALELVSHLADFEPVLADRMRRVAAMDKPLLMYADENAFAAHLGYHERDLEEELHLIEVTRRQMARVLRALPAEAWARTGVHSERGLLSLEQVVTLAINHIPHHLRYLQEKRRALGLA